MAIERSKRPIAAARLASTARKLLDTTTLCAVATVAAGGQAHVNTTYFAWSPRFDLVWLSAPGAKHSRSIRANGSAAVAVYDSSQTWGKHDRGLQLFGSARELDGAAVDEAEALYAGRFAAYRGSDFEGYRFYRLRPRRLKLFDERMLGRGTFVTARPDGRGGLVWERTEIYLSAA